MSVGLYVVQSRLQVQELYWEALSKLRLDYKFHCSSRPVVLHLRWGWGWVILPLQGCLATSGGIFGCHWH